MSQEYTVREVKATYEAQYGKKRVAFTTNETGGKSLSAFTPFPETIAPGKKIYGDVSEKRVNDRIFYNFTFAKGGDAPQGAVVQRDVSLSEEGRLSEIRNMLMFKVIPMLTELVKGKDKKVDYPEYSQDNDAHGFDEYRDSN